jgi:hypothetical protein
MDKFSLDSVVARNAELVTADMDGETVMMSIENGKYFHLSKIGSAIWELLETPLAVGALIDRLLETYDVPRAQCEKETLAFLGDLRREGVITGGQAAQ